MLPVGYRVGSAVSFAVYVLMSLIAFDRSGWIDVFTDGFSRMGIWVVFGYLALGVLMNAVSRSKPERCLMTPVSLALAVLSLMIALSAPAG